MKTFETGAAQLVDQKGLVPTAHTARAHGGQRRVARLGGCAPRHARSAPPGRPTGSAAWPDPAPGGDDLHVHAGVPSRWSSCRRRLAAATAEGRWPTPFGRRFSDRTPASGAAELTVHLPGPAPAGAARRRQIIALNRDSSLAGSPRSCSYWRWTKCIASLAKVSSSPPEPMLRLASSSAMRIVR